MPPQVGWAQRAEFVTLTVALVDATDVDVKFEEKAVNFSAKVGETAHTFALALEGEIKPEESTFSNTMREIQIKLQKKDDGFWEKLTEKKTNFVKVDWARWKDEDELDGADALGDFGGMPGGMGGMPGGMGGMGGMPGMGGMGGMPGMGGPGGMPGMPEGMDMASLMAQMGGAGGMGGMPGMEGMAGMPGMGGEEGDSDDEKPEPEEAN